MRRHNIVVLLARDLNGILKTLEDDAARDGGVASPKSESFRLASLSNGMS